MKSPGHGGLLLWWGALFLAGALFFQTVTIASGNYTFVICMGLVLTVVADICLIFAYRRGGFLVRVGSVLLLLPTLFVVFDVLRRAPHLFR